MILFKWIYKLYFFMWIDLKKFKKDYDTYFFEQKKETVTIMLKVLLGKWDNFDNIYNFIINNPDQVFESELDEVFGILLLWMYQDSQDKLKEAEWKLDMVKQKMLQIKQQEEKEKQQEDPEKILFQWFSLL